MAFVVLHLQFEVFVGVAPGFGGGGASPCAVVWCGARRIDRRRKRMVRMLDTIVAVAVRVGGFVWRWLAERFEPEGRCVGKICVWVA